MKYLLDLLLYLLLFYASREDLFDRQVSDKYTATFAFLTIAFSGADLNSRIFAVLLFVVAIKLDDKSELIGSADIIIYAGLIARLGLGNIIHILLIVNLLALLLYCIESGLKSQCISKSNSLAMMPVFFLSYPILLLL